ncbi:nucleotidyltransferase domain-containing protein [Oleisolibacter albus]|uniref:nucleotidyltransferase domain-containing protein n=1 Tax=Oleisolibacter albus TaxID=2171757 RepID=UPI000DF2F689|nr:nucleotidyltransferase domain-containing protein [Oleisolibacter albus]
MSPQIPTVDIADAVLREWTEHPEVIAAFLAGSVAKGTATAGSDIDAVIVYSHLDGAVRETHERGGFMLELFLHDPDTLAWFWDNDRQAGKPSLARMVANGLPLAGQPEVIEELKRQAQAVLDGGPPPLSDGEMRRRRYAISDLAADLAQDRTRAEQLAIGTRLYIELADFTLRAALAWSGSGKGLAKALRRLDPGLAAAFEHAFAELFALAEPTEALALVDLCLEPYGGRLTVGDRRAAPADWRMGD